MQLFAYRNTMRSAKFKTTLPVNNNVKLLAVKPPEFPTVAEFRSLAQRVNALELAANRVPLELTPITPKGPYRIQYATIARRICRVFKVKKAHLLSDRRDRRLILCRHAVMYWACRLTDRSLPEIGRLMGGKDHTTILHAYRSYPDKRAAMGRNLRALNRSQAGAPA